MARHELYHVDTEVFSDGRFAAWIWINGDRPHLLSVNATADRTVLVRGILVDELALRPFMTAIRPAPLAGGAATPLTLYRLDSVILGQYSLEHPLVAVADEVSNRLQSELEALGVDGVLGMDWLRLHFDRVFFDLVERRLELWQRSDDSSGS